MDLSQFLNLKGAAPSEIDEALYELIASELASDQVKSGLWTKALSDSDWNEAKAKSYYVKMRHDQLLSQYNDSKKNNYNNETISYTSEAIQFGLSDEEIRYLGAPIKAIRYLEKYKKTKEQVTRAISSKKIAAVYKNEVLWLSDKPF